MRCSARRVEDAPTSNPPVMSGRGRRGRRRRPRGQWPRTPRCALQRERVRGEEGEWKLRKEGLSRLEPPPPIPADGSVADCRDLAASDLEAPPMKLGTQREGDRLQAIPGSDDRDTLGREDAEALGQRLRISCRLDDEVRTASLVVARTASPSSSGSTASSPHAWATSRRHGFGSLPTTTAPLRARRIAVRIPIGPRPTTAATSRWRIPVSSEI